MAIASARQASDAERGCSVRSVACGVNSGRRLIVEETLCGALGSDLGGRIVVEGPS
jgi:hypothetical protein